MTNPLNTKDTIIFCEVSQEQLLHLNWILMYFEAILGLKIILEKSELILVRRVEYLKVLVFELGCQMGRLPYTYIGLPLGVQVKSTTVWDDVVQERFQKRLAT